MSYSSVKSSIPNSDQAAADNGSGNAAANCCSRASSELKLYQAFIFSVPIFFTFVLLLLFYLFYLRRRRVDWSSLRMRTVNSLQISEAGDDASRCELGVKKELREMLPIIVFKESFSVKDTQCSVCLGDYQAEDKLQQIPACRHTFHMECIDLWLATHTTCPLCRQSLLASSKTDSKPTDAETVGQEEVSHSGHQNGPLPDEDLQASQQLTAAASESEMGEPVVVELVVESGERGEEMMGGDDNVDVKNDDGEVGRHHMENTG